MIKTVLVRILFVMLPALVIMGLHTDISRRSNELSAVPNMIIRKITSIMKALLSRLQESAKRSSNGSSKESSNESAKESTKESNAEDVTEGFDGEVGLSSNVDSKTMYGVVAFDAHAPSDLTDRDFDRLPDMFNEMRERSKKFRKKNDWVSAIIQKRQMEEVALACSTIRKCEFSHD